MQNGRASEPVEAARQRRLPVLLSLTKAEAIRRRCDDDQLANAITFAWLAMRTTDARVADLSVMARRAVCRALRGMDGLRCRARRYDATRRPGTLATHWDEAFPWSGRRDRAEDVVLIDDLAEHVGRSLTAHQRRILSLRREGRTWREIEREVGICANALNRHLAAIRAAFAPHLS